MCLCEGMILSVCGWGKNEQARKTRAQTATSARLGVGVQVRGIMGEKVLLLIAALELWPALWSTKGPSDTLQWLGLVNICPTSGMPRFLLSHPPSGMIPNPEPHIYCTFSSFALVWLTWGVIGIHTCLCELGTRACQELRSPLVLFSFTDFTQVQLYGWCNDSFTGAMVKFSLTVLLFDFMLMKWMSGTHKLNMNAQCHEKVLAPSWCLLHSSHT